MRESVQTSLSWRNDTTGIWETAGWWNSANVLTATIRYGACNTAPQQAPLKEKNLPKHVILIGFDGLSAHCLNNGADMPTFRKMMAEGASTLENRSILPCPVPSG